MTERNTEKQVEITRLILLLAMAIVMATMTIVMAITFAQNTVSGVAGVAFA